jgi:glycosyltransferase involved in cell wall biosynthesis
LDFPRITVITPSYNQASYLEKTILSVLDQHYPNLEYIIMDGGSTDSSIEIIQKYAQKITYWESIKDEGQSHAINKGLAMSTGEIVTWLNSDDCYTPNTLHQVAHYFKTNDCDFLYGSTLLYGNKIKNKIQSAPKDHVNLRTLAHIPFPQPSTFFKKQIISETGPLDQSLHYGMDYDLVARVALNFKMMGVDDLFSHYLVHDQSKTNHLMGFAMDWQQVFSNVVRTIKGLEKYIPDLKALNLYHNGTKQYPCKHQYTDYESKQILCYFLEMQLHYHYLACQMEKVMPIAQYLLKHDDNPTRMKEIKSISTKAAYLPKFIIKLLRKFTQ